MGTIEYGSCYTHRTLIENEIYLQQIICNDDLKKYYNLGRDVEYNP